MSRIKIRSKYKLNQVIFRLGLTASTAQGIPQGFPIALPLSSPLLRLFLSYYYPTLYNNKFIISRASRSVSHVGGFFSSSSSQHPDLNCLSSPGQWRGWMGEGLKNQRQGPFVLLVTFGFDFLLATETHVSSVNQMEHHRFPLKSPIPCTVTVTPRSRMGSAGPTRSSTSRAA